VAVGVAVAVGVGVAVPVGVAVGVVVGAGVVVGVGVGVGVGAGVAVGVEVGVGVGPAKFGLYNTVPSKPEVQRFREGEAKILLREYWLGNEKLSHVAPALFV
jgi:hypothetical protein